MHQGSLYRLQWLRSDDRTRNQRAEVICMIDVWDGINRSIAEAQADFLAIGSSRSETQLAGTLFRIEAIAFATTNAR